MLSVSVYSLFHKRENIKFQLRVNSIDEDVNKDILKLEDQLRELDFLLDSATDGVSIPQRFISLNEKEFNEEVRGLK